jgi:predicted permease
LSEEQAREVAIREFGNIAGARQDLEIIDRRMLRGRARADWWFDTRRDAVVSARSFRRQPVVTAAILITLALGIGANAAIFTVMQAALLAPLPYERADRLVHVWQTRASGSDRSASSYPEALELRASVHSFAQVEGYDPTNVAIAGAESAEMIHGGRVTAGFFAMLGVKPVIGRTFAIGDDGPGAPNIAVLSHGLWMKRFRADSGVIGRSVIIDDVPFEIVGVLPQRFQFAPIGAADVWMPLNRSTQARAARTGRWLNVVARLRDGATIQSADRQLTAVMRRLAEAYPESNAGRSAIVVPLRDEVAGNVRSLLLVLTGAATLTLLIACANTAGLLVARTVTRRREFAVRAALGASRWRIVRQIVTESLLLSLIGGALAIIVAGVGTNVLISAIPEGPLSGMPFWNSRLGTSAVSVIYSVVVALSAGILFGLIPAVSAWRTSFSDSLRRAGRAVAGGDGRLRETLVAGEIALTIVLLVGTALLLRSFGQLMRIDAGFDAEQVVTARVALAGPRYASPSTRRRFFDDVLTRVRAIPHVQAAGAISNLPLSGGGTSTFEVVGAPHLAPSELPTATTRVVSGDYFDALRISLMEGRQFTTQDDTTSPRVLLINASLARQLFGTASAVGRRVRFQAAPQQEWEVIGVVGDVKTLRLDAPVAPTIYTSQLQTPQNRMSITVRLRCAGPTGGGLRDPAACDPEAVARALRRAAAVIDPSVAVYGAGTMKQQLVDSPAVFARRYPLLLVGLFAATALLLAVVGLYGVISFAVTQRTREFGVRLALGAPPGSIRAMVLRRGAVVAGVGICLGVPVAVALSGGMRALLYGVGPLDPLAYAAACSVLVSVAMIASWIPAHHATRIPPGAALRAE